MKLTGSLKNLPKLLRPEFIPQFVRETSYVEHLEPEEYTIDCSRYQRNLASNNALKAKVTDRFRRVGFVYLVNTGTTDPSTLLAPFKHILGVGNKYDGGANPRDYIDQDVYNTGAIPQQTLHYHHEMQYLHESIRSIAFFCLGMSEGVDGSTYFSNNIGYTRDMERRHIGQKIIQKGTCIVRRWTDRNYFKDRPLVNYYNHWQQSFLTEHRKEVEMKLNKFNVKEISWDPETGLLEGKFYPPVYEYCPHIDRNLLYSTISDHAIWFDTDVNISDIPDNDRPHVMYLGDGSEFTKEEVMECIEVADNHGLKINWKPGEAALACNYRFMHGRAGVSLKPGQERKLGVTLGEKFERMGPLPGKY
ncbi:uncharacterized protein LOC134844311 [Symsagittifera roscoffensis]|uniref:uncharacterized protein LOC134844311 n=1 Tax=Symsagittifera roscoffensis TaxID=84072 RepID=UPI00307BBF91